MEEYLERKDIIEKLESELNVLKTKNDVLQVKSMYLGKDGIVTKLSSKMKEIPNEQKREYGKFLNEIKQEVEENINLLLKKIEERELQEKLQKEKIDITLPGRKINYGSLHPMTRVTEEFEDLFVSMGYTVYSGPEVESDENCFQKLNIPKNHPARDAQDTFYLKDEFENFLLRSQTSTAQARAMQENKDKGPIRIVCPGKVYRRDNPQMSKGRFREFFQCDFDIAGGNYGTMIPDAEVIKIVVEILTQLPIGNFNIKINHRLLLDSMVEICGIGNDKYKLVCSSIDKLDKEEWEQVRDELINVKGVTEEQADKLKNFVVLKDKPKILLEKLLTMKEFLENEKGKKALDEMTLLIDYLQILEVEKYCTFDLSLARGLDYYTGLIYETVLTDTDEVGSISGGGRYDNLIGMFSGKQIPAVGVSIGIERIFNILEKRCFL